jgi:hypothetical protein
LGFNNIILQQKASQNAAYCSKKGLAYVKGPACRN